MHGFHFKLWSLVQFFCENYISEKNLRYCYWSKIKNSINYHTWILLKTHDRRSRKINSSLLSSTDSPWVDMKRDIFFWAWSASRKSKLGRFLIPQAWHQLIDSGYNDTSKSMSWKVLETGLSTLNWKKKNILNMLTWTEQMTFLEQLISL